MNLFADMTVEFWHWWILACLILVLEMLLPGVIFLWLAIAAAVSGVIVLIVPDISVELQLIAFGVASVVSFVLGRRVLRPGRSGLDEEDVSSASSSLVGKTAILDDNTSNGRIRQSVYGSSWVLQSEGELSKGQKVRVYGIDGNTLLIRPVTDQDGN